MSTEHDLKTWPEYYQEVASGAKPFEYRLNDRDYKVDDVLHLREWVPALVDEEHALGLSTEIRAGYYTGRSLRKRVTYILPAADLGPHAKAQHATHVIMGLGPLYVGPDIEPQPWVPMSDPKAIKVIGKALEERGEVVAALARCLIQGIDAADPSTGKPNREWLEDEMADEVGTWRMVGKLFMLDMDRIAERANRKEDFLAKWLGMMPSL